MQRISFEDDNSKGVSVGLLLGIYFFVLAGSWLLDFLRPSAVGAILNLIGNFDVELQPLRFRIFLFFSATLCFGLLLPIVFWKGLGSSKVRSKANIHWSHCIVAMIAVPLGWLMYPKVATCKNCWMEIDVFFFVVTVLFFLVLHIFAQGVWMSMKQLWSKDQ